MSNNNRHEDNLSDTQAFKPKTNYVDYNPPVRSSKQSI